MPKSETNQLNEQKKDMVVAICDHLLNLFKKLRWQLTKVKFEYLLFQIGRSS